VRTRRQRACCTGWLCVQVSDGSEARALTRDHKPSSNPMEMERLRSLGATLSLDGYLQLQVCVCVCVCVSWYCYETMCSCHAAVCVCLLRASI